jgi:alanine racemase
VIRHDALRANIARVGDPASAVLDLRFDAYGHGVAEVARTAAACGVGAVLVDEEIGVDGVRELRRGSPTVDAAALYGLPGGGVLGSPVMSLVGRVISTKALLAGEGVSYGYRFRASSDTHVALVSGGYAQGVVRALGGRIDVAIAARRHPVVGRVAMDVCVVDIGDARPDRGDDVRFFGDEAEGSPALAAWASASGLTAIEIVTAVGLHTEREHRLGAGGSDA